MRTILNLRTPWIAALLMVCASAASAMDTQAVQVDAQPVAAPASEGPSQEAHPVDAQPWEPLPVGRRIDVGSATESLLAAQRAARGSHPRPIQGDQASRSYQRYLKSFETTIPEQFSTGIDVAK